MAETVVPENQLEEDLLFLVGVVGFGVAFVRCVGEMLDRLV